MQPTQSASSMACGEALVARGMARPRPAAKDPQKAALSPRAFDGLIPSASCENVKMKPPKPTWRAGRDHGEIAARSGRDPGEISGGAKPTSAPTYTQSVSAHSATKRPRPRRAAAPAAPSASAPVCSSAGLAGPAKARSGEAARASASASPSSAVR